MMPRNKLRKLLREGKTTIGTHYSCTWANLVEIVGNSQQFDYAEFTGEYGPYTLHDLEHLARACEITGMDAMIKIDQEPRTHIATRAIQAGFTAMLFADCSTARGCQEMCSISQTDSSRRHQRRSIWTSHGIRNRQRAISDSFRLC